MKFLNTKIRNFKVTLMIFLKQTNTNFEKKFIFINLIDITKLFSSFLSTYRVFSYNKQIKCKIFYYYVC